MRSYVGLFSHGRSPVTPACRGNASGTHPGANVHGRILSVIRGPRLQKVKNVKLVFGILWTHRLFACLGIVKDAPCAVKQHPGVSRK